MPTIYEVQAPDGSILEIEGPDNATNEQIAAFAAQQFGGATENVAAPSVAGRALTAEDEQASQAIQNAWNTTGDFDAVAKVAAQFGRTFAPVDEQFLRANKGNPVNIRAAATGETIAEPPQQAAVELPPSESAELRPDITDPEQRLAAGLPQLSTPDTTVEGLAGAGVRGLAPTAAGALLGAALAAPTVVGIPAGAAIGATAAGLTQLVGDPIVMGVNKLFGTSFTEPTTAIENLLTQIGVPEARTAAERVMQTAAGAAGGGGATKGLGEVLQAGAPAMSTRGLIGAQLAEAPGAQILAGTTGGAAQQTAAESGAGPVGQTLAAVAGGLTPAGISAAARGVAGGVSRIAATPLVQEARTALEEAVGTARTAMPGAAQPTAGGRASVGAAATPEERLRVERAQELPVPIELARFQRTRSFQEQQRARELAKDNEIGGPIRERMAQQMVQMRQNFEALVDQTGSEIWNNLGELGVVVTKALRDRAAKDKTKIRALYKVAEKQGELVEPVTAEDLVTYLNANRTGRRSAPILSVVEEELLMRGGATGSLADGTLRAKPLQLGELEEVRKAIGRFAKGNDPNDLRVGGEMKNIIDTETAELGGQAYKRARAARRQYAMDYEDTALIKQLIGTKRGSTERAVALEKVAEKSIYSQSTPLDSVKKLKDLLETEGPAGQQAWRELQGATMEHIRNQAYGNIARNEAGNAVISPTALDRVITNLDASGKLDFVFGKKEAELLRTINTVAKDVFTAPPGSVNTSNTTSALVNAIDTMATFSTVGVPIPAIATIKALRNAAKTSAARREVQELLD